MVIRTTLNQLTYRPVCLATAGAPDDEEPCTSSIGKRKWNPGMERGSSHVILSGFTTGGCLVSLMLHMLRASIISYGGRFCYTHLSFALVAA